MRLEDHIEDIPDFPKPGIVYKDITPLFLDAAALRQAVDELAGYARELSVGDLMRDPQRKGTLTDAERGTLLEAGGPPQR